LLLIYLIYKHKSNKLATIAHDNSFANKYILANDDIVSNFGISRYVRKMPNFCPFTNLINSHTQNTASLYGIDINVPANFIPLKTNTKRFMVWD